jgi:glutamine---fructose-6-phosphate transaminase (isomerizing)
MCGIVGYVGKREASELLVTGLRRLEYRGYDSAGIATMNGDNAFSIRRSVGRIDSLAAELADAPALGHIGIGHTRWATHGPATKNNAHPHMGGDCSLVLAHNGVIENFHSLKTKLQDAGYIFKSATDTEVIAHLIDQHLKEGAIDPRAKSLPEKQQPFASAILQTLDQLRGTYGLAILFRDCPNAIFAARLGSPLVIGIGQGENFVASDAAPLVGNTQKIVYLADHQMAVVTRETVRVIHREQGHVAHNVQKLETSLGDVDLGAYAHYMHKEIHEQPESLENCMRGRLHDEDATAIFGGLNLSPQDLQGVRRIILTACGTSWHAALVGEYLIEELARIPVEVEYASELRYRNPPLEAGTLLFAITQSGETADTLAALREMKRKGHPALAICNVVGSTIAQDAFGGIYLHAGPEIGVASTKAYTAQCLVMAMLALYFGRMKHMSYQAGQRIIQGLRALPDKVREALKCEEEVKKVAEKYVDATTFLYLGRQHNFPTALEGALKLKEISYIHAEGYPAAEMKHGPIALVDKHTPSVFIMPQGFVYDKVMSNLEEIKARGGPVIAIVSEKDERICELADDVIQVPHVEEFLQPIVASIPLQLLAYHIALLRGCDVDKPRNLAKSVTVE